MKVARTYRITPTTDKQIKSFAEKLDVSEAEVIQRAVNAFSPPMMPKGEKVHANTSKRRADAAREAKGLKRAIAEATLKEFARLPLLKSGGKIL